MKALKALWDRIMMEPVLLTALVAAVVMLLVEYNVPVTEGQQDAIQAVVVAVAALFARSRVSSKRFLKS